MKKIFKYELKFSDMPVVEMSVGAEILTVNKQGDSLENPSVENRLFIWAIVDEDEKRMEERKFRVVGTGHPLGEDFDAIKKYSKLKYINTIFIFDGYEVFHIFEIINEKEN